MQTEELAIQYRKYRNALKILTLVLVISADFGIFYWQVTAAKAEVVETWGMADAKEISINSKVSGLVVKLFVEEGDRVNQGQLIAKIDSDSQEPQQRAAQAEVASAQANPLKNDENKALEQAARDQAAALQGQLDAVNVMLGETEIFAPFAGVVTKKFAEEGMLISPTVPLYSLQDAADNWIDFKGAKDFAGDNAQRIQPADT